MLKNVRHTIACPVSWCIGSFIDHGGFGDEPQHWVHSDGTGIEIAEGLTLCRSQIASGAIRWHLFAQTEELAQAGDRHALADKLRELAQKIEKDDR